MILFSKLLGIKLLIFELIHTWGYKTYSTHLSMKFILHINVKMGSVVAQLVECQTGGWTVASSKLTGVTVVCHWARNIIRCLELVHHSDFNAGNHTEMTEKLLTGM